jgi:hypothetical protein
VLEAEIPEIRIETEYVRGHDENNAFLGVFGVTRPWLALTRQGEPLRVRVPISLKLDKMGRLHFELSELTTNLGELREDGSGRMKLDFCW